MTEHLYAEHLYDSTRREIAIELMEKEMSKQMPSVNPADIRTWMSNIDENTFWNAVEGFMGGALIKPIAHFLTAENYTWSKREVQLEDIQLSSPLTQLDGIDELTEQPPLLKEVKAYLEKNPREQENQLATIESFSHGEDQDSYPVLVVEKSNGPMVMDGNRRTLNALLMGESAITAWYCETNGEQPHNFWYPIDDMIRLVNIYNSSKETNPDIKENVKRTLQALFLQSDVALRAFEERIVKAGKSGAKDLLI
jgi:hypothetical protein